MNWLNSLINVFSKLTQKGTAVIRKNGPASKPYCIFSKTGKNLGCYATRKQAEKRLKQIEMFKHMKKGK